MLLGNHATFDKLINLSLFSHQCNGGNRILYKPTLLFNHSLGSLIIPSMHTKRWDLRPLTNNFTSLGLSDGTWTQTQGRCFCGNSINHAWDSFAKIADCLANTPSKVKYKFDNTTLQPPPCKFPCSI